MRKEIKILKVLSNPSRYRIIELLLYRTLSVSEISKKIKISFKSISKHLRLLENIGLIERK